jgi:Ohr subfamily peroxiredoxin
MTTKVEKVIYQAHATSTGGRDGTTRTSDGLLDLKLAVPKEMGGAGGGVNPEQLFAAGYSACFIGAMKFVAGMQKLPCQPTPASTPPSVLARFLLASALKCNLPSLFQAWSVLPPKPWWTRPTPCAPTPTPPVATLK